MKKFLIITLVVFVSTVGLVLDSLAEKKPQYGGILKVVTSMGPRSFYMPEGGPTDLTAEFPGIEALQMYRGRDLVPQLAESVDLDPDGLTLTFRLRKGIKFHDGSSLDADNVIWGINFAKEKGRLMDAKRLKSIEKLDDYTVRLHVTEYTNMLIHNLGWGFQMSKQAYTTHDVDWLRSNFVGTGPFKMVEWKRDAHMKWVKNENYWRKGRPYLDGMEFYYVPDPVVASAMLEAGEVDMWTNTPVKHQVDLEKKGFIRSAGYGALPGMIYFNTTDPNMPTSKVKVRQAIEYAIDKAAISKAIGFGYYEPLKMTAPEGEWGYDPDYKGRPYNPEMARKLLAEAGYPKGLKLELLAFMTIGGGAPAGEAIKGYLADVGIDCKVDLADPGRYW
ncbi:MAG: ABC transporter substrate-binding protein, partial [Desulfobacterales bacterium]|nr:ABC transporter substrate-binding protein [Desulfobacterales bacterium]